MFVPALPLAAIQCVLCRYCIVNACYPQPVMLVIEKNARSNTVDATAGVQRLFQLVELYYKLAICRIPLIRAK